MERGPLRLKGSGGALGAGKREKKVKDKAQILEQITSSKKQQEEKRGLHKQTPAQVAFEKMQERRRVERVLKRAAKTHKRVQQFNRHLDALTSEHSQSQLD